jgi:hypothetical protein
MPRGKGGRVSCLEGREAGAKHRAEGEPGRQRPRRGNALIYLIFLLKYITYPDALHTHKKFDDKDKHFITQQMYFNLNLLT